MSSTKLAVPICGLFAIVFVCVVTILHQRQLSDEHSDSAALHLDSKPLILGGRYKGKNWRKAGSTLSVVSLIESPFARVELHEVKNPKTGKSIPDWIWFDEGDNVNILVHGTDNNPTAPKVPSWIVFRQTKYAFEEGTTSLAPVGGFINEHETPLMAAKREVLEELGLACEHWEALGMYRTLANRGAGFNSPFVASRCVPNSKTAFSDDMEAQQRVYLDDIELKTALLKGEFQEVKWTATVALALLSKSELG